MTPSARLVPLVLTLALCTGLGIAAPTHAQTADATIVASATVPKDRLVSRYSELAGSDAAAAKLIDQLRTGGDFSVTTQQTTTVTNPDGTTTTTTTPVTTTVANPNGPMGYGEVNITLSLAQALVDSGAAADLQSALTGTTRTITNPDGTTTTTTTGGVLAMRADGMGWGRIAKELGFNLGTLMSASNRNTKATAAAGAKAGNAPDRAKGSRETGTAQAERGANARTERGAGAPERVTKVERPTRPEKIDRPARPERPERPQKPERGGR